jgi:uncharacterized protein YbjT (DUF2867 family)
VAERAPASDPAEGGSSTHSTGATTGRDDAGTSRDKGTGDARRGRLALVLGATGDQGWPQVGELVAHGWRVRAAARTTARLSARIAEDPALAAAAREGRVEAVAVNHADAASLERALAGADVLLANYPSSSFHDARSLIDGAAAAGAAAARAGVQRVVFNTSLPMPATPLGYAAQDVRFAQREALGAHGVPVITLAPVVYMGNLLRGWAYPAIVERSAFEYPHYPDTEVAWICQEDLAKLMVAAAARPALAGRTLNVGGPERLRGADVARVLSEVLGRPIEFTSQPIEDFCARMRAVFARDATLDAARLVDELGRIYRWYNEAPERPFAVDMTPVLAELPVRLTTLREWAARQRW